MTDHQVIQAWLNDPNADIQIGIQFYAKFSRNKILLSRFAGNPDHPYTRDKLRVELERLLPMIDAKQETLRTKYTGPVQSEKLPPYPDRNTNIKTEPLASAGDSADPPADAPAGAQTDPTADAPAGAQTDPPADPPSGNPEAKESGDAPAEKNYPPEVVNLLVKRQTLYNQRQKLSNQLYQATTDAERQEIGATIDRLSEDIAGINSQVKEFDDTGKLPGEPPSEPVQPGNTLKSLSDAELILTRNNLRASISKINKAMKAGNLTPSKLEKKRGDLAEKTKLLKDVEEAIRQRTA